MEYGERNEICALINRRKQEYYLHAKALKRSMSAIRRRQNLVPKARTKKELAMELAERKADEEQLAAIRKDYRGYEADWRVQDIYRNDTTEEVAFAKIARLERLLRDAGGER